jgi:cellulose biosynthesis protein BcsQ
MKGGVGKSTTTMMIADTIALHQGLQCLVVDLDPQANSSQMIMSYEGLKHAADASKTLTKWMKDLGQGLRGDFFDAVRPDVCGIDEVRNARAFRWGSARRTGDIAIVPATPELRFAELAFDHRTYDPSDPSKPRRELQKALRAGLRSLGTTYDLVVFDCPPGFTTLAQGALSIADAIISPMLEDPVSLWSLVSFRDFGLKETLGVWEPERHKVLYTRVRSAGANGERAAVRNDLRKAGFTAIPVHIRDVAQAIRWTQRPAHDSFETFARKYGPARIEVEHLGKSICDFVAELDPRNVMENPNV